MDKRREAFESYCLSDSGGYCEHHLERDSQGRYLAVWESWDIWNAALDSVEIELPGGLLLRSEIKPILEAAGLKVKP